MYKAILRLFFTKLAITRWSWPKRQDGAIKANRRFYLDWPNDSWKKQPTINYFGKVSKESSDKPALQQITIVRNKVKPVEVLDEPLFWERYSENASRKVIQDFGTHMFAINSRKQQDQGQARVPITNGMKPAFDFKN